ncbi:FtsX-like permease family protein [Agarivorans sp. B2Z047]|uniref:ABC transporter permease n=1 Tax=Agarivorans sp. B2Z047 TaxID=2652721 RepID=UPI00128DF0BF|nr:ABC transporter permease [Agarivorans sp. B2Z047]MPW31328.1 FtsX-like permease family protein [Agarivorans sp. B2Z047]UQN42709.1 ABC transporter permease [Agarivorans sp. B2Z047]
MSLLKLAWHSLWARRGTALLSLLTIALSVALLLGVENLRTQAKSSFASTISGTDLIVGARSGPTQLLLYSVFRIGNATNNISWDSYQEIAGQSSVKWSIPISLGDSHRGYRVMGTTNSFFEHYQYANKQPLEFAQGQQLNDTFEVVLGAEVARKLGYKLGDKIVVAHGIAAVSFVNHDQFPFEVSGILKPTGTPVDRTVITSLAGIEAIHLPPQTQPFTEAQLSPSSITAMMLGTQSRLQIFNLQRQINQYKNEALLAILPGVALQELWGILSIAESALLAVSICVVITGLMSMLSTLMVSLKERRREMAILRSVGAKPRHIFGLLLIEALLLSALGALLGLASMYLILGAAKPILLNQFGFYLVLNWPTVEQCYLLLAVVVVGFLAGVLPAWRAYRYSLSDGMSIKI